MKELMTIGDLREAIKDLDDSQPIYGPYSSSTFAWDPNDPEESEHEIFLMNFSEGFHIVRTKEGNIYIGALHDLQESDMLLYSLDTGELLI